ncbi:MAG: CotH kinase family protein [Clostridia bacterium]|nr:CotH kinase family protein [Clostridia bacterium]
MVRTARRIPSLLLALILSLAALPLAGCRSDSDSAGADPAVETVADGEGAGEELPADPEPAETAADENAPAAFADSTALFQARTARTKAAPGEMGVRLTYRGVELPTADGRYFLPISDAFEPEDLLGLAALAEPEEEPRLLIDSHIFVSGISAFLAHNTPLEIMVCTEDAFAQADLIFTTLPVLSADLARDRISGREKDCAFSLWEARGKDLRRTDSPAALKVRGASSASLAKTPLKLELRDGNGEGRNLPLLGMRKDDDWILCASYSDYAHVRDAVGLALWGKMAEALDLKPAGALETRFVELILGGSYDGFYLMMEKFDAKTLGLDAEKGDALFKCISWDVPDSAGLRRQPPRSPAYSSMEKKFPDPEDRTDGNWETLADYVALSYEADGSGFAEGIEEKADRRNMLAYWLFLNLTMAADNTWKNTYYAEIGGKICAFPWDLDISFGLGWNGDPANNYLYEQAGMAERTYDFQTGRRMLKYIKGCADEVKEMYEILKEKGIAGADDLIADAEVYWNELHSSGAWARNKTRWPSGNNVDSLDYFRETVKTREAWFEDYLASLD